MICNIYDMCAAAPGPVATRAASMIDITHADDCASPRPILLSLLRLWLVLEVRVRGVLPERHVHLVVQT